MIRKRSEFLAARKGVFSNGHCLRIEALNRKHNDEPPRIGFTVTKKNGNAVVRNRIKRRLRGAILSRLNDDMRAGHDYVFISKPNALNVPFETLCLDIAGLIKKSHKRLDANANQKTAKSD